MTFYMGLAILDGCCGLGFYETYKLLPVLCKTQYLHHQHGVGREILSQQERIKDEQTALCFKYQQL